MDQRFRGKDLCKTDDELSHGYGINISRMLQRHTAGRMGRSHALPALEDAYNAIRMGASWNDLR